MNGIETTRRDFLKGAAASLGIGLFGGRRVFAVPNGWSPSGNPDLVLGVLSDSHLYIRRNLSGQLYFKADGNSDLLRNAFRYFKSKSVHAVMHCGDMAHRGLKAELYRHREVWDSVFADSDVERLFVTGNHDVSNAEGWVENAKSLYGKNDNQYMPEFLYNRLGQIWQDVWGEKYENVWHKTVKGNGGKEYHFLGCNYWPDRGTRTNYAKAMASEALNLASEGKLKGPKPFFTVSHCPQTDDYLNKEEFATVNGMYDPLRNNINFFGHMHKSVSNWNEIFHWLPGAKFPSIQCPPVCPNHRGVSVYFAQALLVKVYDGGVYDGEEYAGGLVIHTIDCLKNHNNVTIGPDWFMPFGNWEAPQQGVAFSNLHPFAKDKLIIAAGAPEFRAGAKLVLSWGKEFVTLTIPCADANFAPKSGEPEVYEGSRVFAYDVEVTGSGKTFTWRFDAAARDYGVGYGEGEDEASDGTTTAEIPWARLPAGDRLVFRVYPCSSMGGRGKPLVVEKKCIRLFVEKSVDGTRPDTAFRLTKNAKIPEGTPLSMEIPPWADRAFVGEKGDLYLHTRAEGATVRLK